MVGRDLVYVFECRLNFYAFFASPSQFGLVDFKWTIQATFFQGCFEIEKHCFSNFAHVAYYLKAAKIISAPCLFPQF